MRCLQLYLSVVQVFSLGADFMLLCVICVSFDSLLHKVKDGLPMLGCSAVDTTTGVCERAVGPGSRR